jgi:hypothetical protein
VVNGGGALADRARGITTDGTNIFITGQFGATATFGSTTLTSADSSDVFIAALTNTGSFLWAKSVGGVADGYEPDSYESGVGITADPSGVAYATGTILDGGIFGTTSLTGYDRTDVFLAKITNTIVANEETTKTNYVSIYPNPSNGIINFSNMPAFSNTQVTIYNQLGESVYKGKINASAKTQIDLSSLTKGVYFLSMTSEKIVLNQKIVLQ